MPKNFSQKGFTKNFLDLMKQEETNKDCCLDFLTKVYTKDGTTVSFTGTGTENDPLIATTTVTFELQTNGTSGPATFIEGVLNIPNYSAASGGTAVPGGSDMSIQFNQAGIFGGNVGFNFNYNTGNVLIGTTTDIGGIYRLQVNGNAQILGDVTGIQNANLILGNSLSPITSLIIVGQSNVYTPVQEWEFSTDGSGNLRLNEVNSGQQIAAFSPIPGTPFLHLYGPETIDGILIQTTGVFYPAKYTTADKLALVVLEGAQVYDTDLHQMSYFNGTTWVNF